MSSGHASSCFVAGKINFEILTRQLPDSVYLALIAAGLLRPIMLCFPAILRGIKVSVHDALADYGIAPDTTGATTEKVAASWLPRRLLLAFRNSLRRKKRLAGRRIANVIRLREAEIARQPPRREMSPCDEPAETTMKQQLDALDQGDVILMAEEPSAWTLDELESSADLASLRSAWAGSDDPNI